jgi:DNA-binding CsgD family transcriptional regulator
MSELHSRVLVEAAFAAGSRDRIGAASEILAILRPATHQEASAIVSWDAVAKTHRSVAMLGYSPQTLAALGDYYATRPEHRTLRQRKIPMTIDDMPPEYRSSEMYIGVLHAAGFSDGLTQFLFTPSCEYAGMVHMSAVDQHTFDQATKDLIDALAPAIAHVCDVGRYRTFGHEIAPGSRVSLVDSSGRTWPVDTFEPAYSVQQAGFGSFVERFLNCSQRAVRGLWPSNAGWLSIHATRAAHPIDGSKEAVLVQEQVVDLPFGLSPREVDVLQGMARGHANNRIAAERSISLRTVTTHVERILQKTGQQSRAGAATLAAREGLLRLDDTVD